MNSINFINKLQEFQSKLDAREICIEDVIDFVYININNLFFIEKFEEVDLILLNLKISKFELLIALSLLTASFVAKEKLNNRNYFYNQVEKLAILLGLEPEPLLLGLK